MSNALLVLITAKNHQEARTIARDLVDYRWAACVNILPIESVYWWEGQMKEDDEVLMLVKTTAEAYHNPEFKDFILDRHSYDLPEIIGLPIGVGSTEYLAWLRENVRTHRAYPA